MFCKNCGKQLEDGVKFCPGCGAPVDTVGQGTYQTQPQPQQQFVDPQRASDANRLLVWGILGIAFACSWALSFLGIIFSSIAKNKAVAFTDAYGIPSGKAKVGQILGRVGFIVGICLTVCFALYIVFWIIWGVLITRGIINFSGFNNFWYN